MEIRDDGKTNPLLIVSAEEVITWLRTKADEAGYADRSMSAIQISVDQPFEGGKTYHHEPPALVVMVSNIKDSRVNHGQASTL